MISLEGKVNIILKILGKKNYCRRKCLGFKIYKLLEPSAIKVIKKINGSNKIFTAISMKGQQFYFVIIIKTWRTS